MVLQAATTLLSAVRLECLPCFVELYVDLFTPERALLATRNMAGRPLVVAMDLSRALTTSWHEDYYREHDVTPQTSLFDSMMGGHVARGLFCWEPEVGHSRYGAVAETAIVCGTPDEEDGACYVEVAASADTFAHMTRSPMAPPSNHDFLLRFVALDGHRFDCRSEHTRKHTFPCTSRKVSKGTCKHSAPYGGCYIMLCEHANN